MRPLTAEIRRKWQIMFMRVYVSFYSNYKHRTLIHLNTHTVQVYKTVSHEIKAARYTRNYVSSKHYLIMKYVYEFHVASPAKLEYTRIKIGHTQGGLRQLRLNRSTAASTYYIDTRIKPKRNLLIFSKLMLSEWYITFRPRDVDLHSKSKYRNYPKF